MNSSNAKDYLPLVQALADGKTIECNNSGRWQSGESWEFNNPPDQYRIKPAPKYRPWKASEGPPNALIRAKNDCGWSKVLGVDPDGIQLCGRAGVATKMFGDLFMDAEHSTNDGLTWSICGIRE